MSSEWKQLTLASIAKFTTGKLDSNAAEIDGIYPFFTCSPETLSINSYAFDTEAILLAGNNANANFPIKYYKGKFNAYQRTYIIESKDGEKFNNKFIFYSLQNSLLKLKELSIGSATKFLTKTILDNLEISCPEILEQERVIEVLGSIDDRITLLRASNATLEAMAQALFKSWFVDFAPVHAKQQGRAPEGMDAATAALFPDSFEESELGMVPKGWGWSTLAACTSYLSRGISPKYVEDGGIPVLNQKCIRDFSVDFSKSRRHDPNLRKVDGRELMHGDVLVNSTGVGTLGRVAQILHLEEKTIVDSHVTVVRAGESINKEYLGCFMHLKQPSIEDMGEGSTGQTELSRQKLGQMYILQPSQEALSAFKELISPLKEKLSVNEVFANQLAILRDTLLPRLISGQLRLPEAEQAVAQAIAA